MEYIYFFAFSAVIGVAVMLFAHLASNRKSVNASGAWVSETPIPPRKRTISGKTETEMDVVQLQDRIMRWQRANAGRWTNFRQSAEAVSGQPIGTLLPGEQAEDQAEQGLELRSRVEVRHAAAEAAVGLGQRRAAEPVLAVAEVDH